MSLNSINLSQDIALSISFYPTYRILLHCIMVSMFNISVSLSLNSIYLSHCRTVCLSLCLSTQLICLTVSQLYLSAFLSVCLSTQRICLTVSQLYILYLPLSLSHCLSVSDWPPVMMLNDDISLYPVSPIHKAGGPISPPPQIASFHNNTLGSRGTLTYSLLNSTHLL